jgi:hypothetical protein
MNFHTFTYNEQMILLSVITTIFVLTLIFILANYVTSKKEVVKTEMPWDDILKWQTIALAVNGLTNSGDLSISFNGEIYTVILLGKIKAFDGFLTYSLSEKNERLDLALKQLDHSNTMKLIEMTTKVGE